MVDPGFLRRETGHQIQIVAGLFFYQFITINVVKGLRAMYHVRSDSVIVFLECVAGG